MALHLGIKLNEVVRIGPVLVRVEGISGKYVKLGIEAPPEFRISRLGNLLKACVKQMGEEPKGEIK